MGELLLRMVSEVATAGRFVPAVGVVLLGVAAIVFGVTRTEFGRRVAHLGARLLQGAVAVLLLAMVFLSGLQILLRNAFDSGILWIDPLLRHLLLLLAFTGALLATGSKRHVQINVLGRLLRGRAGRRAGAVVAALGGTICVFLAHAATELLAEELAFGEIAFLSVPVWGVVLVFPVAFLAMALRFYLLVFEELAGSAPRSAEEGPLAALGSDEVIP